MRLKSPEHYKESFAELSQRYGIVVNEMASAFPAYAFAPGDPAASQKFSREQSNLQQLQADTFQLRSQLEADMETLAETAGSLNRSISSLEDKNKKLENQLSSLDRQSQSARGRLDDSVYLYREALLTNILLAVASCGAGYLALNMRQVQ